MSGFGVTDIHSWVGGHRGRTTIATAKDVAQNLVAALDVVDIDDRTLLGRVIRCVGCVITAAIDIGQYQRTRRGLCVFYIDLDPAHDVAAEVVAAEGVGDGAALEVQLYVAPDGAAHIVATEDLREVTTLDSQFDEDGIT